MADTTTIQEVGMGTQVQVQISMQPLTGTDDNDYSLSDLSWKAYFEGASQFTVLKSDAVMQNNDTYLCLVNTSATGRGEIKAWLEVEGIPTINNHTRKEVTPPVSINLKVV